MARSVWLAPIAAAFCALTVLVSPSGAEARGLGGGFRGGGGGFHGHVGRSGVFAGRGFGRHHHHGFRHGHGHHRHGWHRGRNGGRFGQGGVTWGMNYGYGNGFGGYVDGPRTRGEPSYGIPPSPVLPPAIYVIGPKSGGAARASGPAIRKGRSNPIVTSGPSTGGSSASVIEGRHRMH